jgi:hypothetical protein
MFDIDILVKIKKQNMFKKAYFFKLKCTFFNFNNLFHLSYMIIFKVLICKQFQRNG